MPFPAGIKTTALEAFKTYDAIVSHRPLPVYEELVKDNHCVLHRNVRIRNMTWEHVYQLRSYSTRTIGLTPLTIGNYNIYA